MTNQNINPALNGMKILDCSQILAEPFCSMLLADMGAEIIKVEKPMVRHKIEDLILTMDLNILKK